MSNGYDSWHDSDDIDSDLEQEAYSRLYCNNFEEKKDDINILSTNSNESMEEVNITLDSCEKSENLLNSSDSVIEIESCSDSDSDDVKYVRTIKCSNAFNNLCVDISSDDNECDTIDTSRKTDNSSIMLNIISSKDSVMNSVTSDSDIEAIDMSSNVKNSSVMINVTAGKSQSKTLDIDRLFFNDQPSCDDKWSVVIKPFTSRSKFSSRYFDTSSKSTCTICSKKGHSEADCTRSGPICVLCGNEGHMSKKCDTAVCYACFQTNHQTKNCPLSNKFLRLGCRRCGQRGHSDQICPDLWRQYKYTTASGAPVVAKFSSQNKSSVFCANCAKLGHFTEQCPRSRMNSRFLGPPPIMEIIKFDEIDVYDRARLSYCRAERAPLGADMSELAEEMPSFMGDMDVTTIVNEPDQAQSGGQSDIDMEGPEPGLSNDAQFGNAIIMLSPIKAPVTATRRIERQRVATTVSSTPRGGIPVDGRQRPPKLFDPLQPKVPTKLPGITTNLLKKLFPEETADLVKLPPTLRKKLRKKLKHLIDHGYLPGDSNLTQERMEFWLQEISTGRNLNYREKKKLLGSVSAALHSISDRVSITDLSDPSPETLRTSEQQDDSSKSLSVPESRRRRNKLSRQEKNLKNELKVGRKEKKEIRKASKIINESIKARLRQPSASVNDSTEKKESKKRRFKRRQRKSTPSEIIPSEII